MRIKNSKCQETIANNTLIVSPTLLQIIGIALSRRLFKFVYSSANQFYKKIRRRSWCEKDCNYRKEAKNYSKRFFIFIKRII